MSHARSARPDKAPATFAHDFLAGGGEMGALMRAHDWSASPLGAAETWPQSLRTVVSLLLSSKFPMFVAWGPELGFLYNDAYAAILGAKHPRALGARFFDIWSEIWPDIWPLIERALAGEASWLENLPLTMNRYGYEEQTYFTFSYSPVRNESGGIGGMFCACTETTGHVLAEEARRKSEEQLRALADNLPYGMVFQIETSRDGRERRFTFVSQSSQRLSGVTPEAALRDPTALYDTILPEHRATLATAEEAAIRTLSPMDVEVGFRRADGSPGWCRLISAPRIGSDGWIVWDGLLVDLTDRRRADAALRESEDHYRHTVELNPQVPWRSDPNGQLDLVSRRWLDWTGTSGLGSTWGEAVHPDDLQPSIAAWTRSLATGEPYDIEHRIRLRGGDYHWMHSRAFPRRDEEGRIVKWYGTTEDIQESKAAGERLRESEARLSALFAQAAAGIAQCDLEGRLTLVNDRYCELVGRSREELAGLRMQDITHPDDLAANMPLFAAAIGGGAAFDIEKRYVRPDGSTVWVRNSVTAVRGPDGAVESVLAVATDITDRKRMEEHQNLLINELNHRVKNTLATVQSIATQTLRNAPTTEQARESFESRLMALSRAHDVLTRENWDGAGLREIVAQAVEPYAIRREDRLHIIGRDVRLAPRMALALAMALQELATNAIKYGALSTAAGEVEIEWKTDRKANPPVLRLRWQEKGGPPVAPPQRRGFGSRLIERSLAQDLGGEVRIDFPPTGIVCTVEAPLA